MGRALGWCMSISCIPQTLAPLMVTTVHEPLVLTRGNHGLAIGDAWASGRCDEQIGREYRATFAVRLSPPGTSW
jgi:hypothetical protein